MRFYRRTRALLPLLLMFVAVLAVPATLHAAETAASEAPYLALYDAISASADQDAAIDNQIETLKQTMLQDPNISALESVHPGLLVRFGDVLRPWLLKHSHQITEQFKPRFITMLQGELTADDARRMAEFYSSPTGTKLIHNVSHAYNGANTLGDIDEFEQPIEHADVARDVQTAATKAALSLTAADLAAPETAIFKDRVLMAKMTKVGERLISLRTEMENVQPSPEISAGMKADIQKLLEDYTAELGTDVGK